MKSLTFIYKSRKTYPNCWGSSEVVFFRTTYSNSFNDDAKSSFFSAPNSRFWNSGHHFENNVKAGGCFGTKKRMTVGQDEAVCYDTPESRNIEGAASFDPKIYKADRNLKLSKDIIKMLKLHPR